MDLGKRIKAARKIKGWSQAALAEMVGVSTQAVSQWETGKTEPELARVTMVANLLDVDWDWLFGNHGNDDAPVPSKLSQDAGYRAPLIDIADAIGFSLLTAHAAYEVGEEQVTFDPSWDPKGAMFAIMADEDHKRYNKGDVLIFDNGFKVEVGDIAAASVILRGGKWKVIIGEIEDNNFIDRIPYSHPADGMLRHDLLPSLEQYGGYATLIAPAVERRIFRPALQRFWGGIKQRLTHIK